MQGRDAGDQRGGNRECRDACEQWNHEGGDERDQGNDQTETAHDNHPLQCVRRLLAIRAGQRLTRFYRPIVV